MAGKKIVVLGGGIGGVAVASLLRKKLGKEHQVTLVDREGKHYFGPSFLWVLEGTRKPGQVVRNLAPLGKKGIEIMVGEATSIDVERKQVTVDSKSLPFDYLVVSLGAELAPETVPGFSQGAYNLYDLESLVKLREAVLDFTRGRVVVLVAATPFKCPAAPYEAALILASMFRKRGIRDRIEIELFTPEPQPMPVAGPAMGAAVRAMVEGRGIKYHPNTKIASIDPTKRELAFEGGQKISYDLLAGVPPHRAPAVIRKSPLAGEMGWIPIDRENLETKYQNIYAIGDVTATKLPNGMMLPKAGVFAYEEAKALAQCIASKVREKGPQPSFNGDGSCFIELGGGKAAYAMGAFYTNPPLVKPRRPGRWWHWQKFLFEKYWFWRWF